MVTARKTITAIVSGLVCAFLLSTLSANAATNKKTVKLAYMGWDLGTAVTYVGKDAGLFEKYGLDLEEVFISDGVTGAIRALIGVDLVVGFGSPVTILQPILEGSDIVFLGSHVRKEQYGLGVSSDIVTIKDLKGKKIGVSALGRRSDLIVRVLLRRAGLDPLKDVNIVSAGFSPQRMVALSNNLIQGAPLSPEVALQARKLGLKVLKVKEVPVVTSLVMTTRSFAAREHEAVRRFMKGYLNAIRYYLTHRKESVAIIKKYVTGVDSEALEAMYDTFAAQLTPVPGPNGEAVRSLIDVVSVADLRAISLQPRDLFDLRFLEELKTSGFIDQLYSEKIGL
ncbi:MAG: ABC transporter substrate-binding protein [Candidatus Binatia bacterium]